MYTSTTGDGNDRRLRQVKERQPSEWGDQMPVYYIPDKSHWQSCRFPRSLYPPEEPNGGLKNPSTGEQFSSRFDSSLYHRFYLFSAITLPPMRMGTKLQSFRIYTSIWLLHKRTSRLGSRLWRTRRRCFEWILGCLRSSRVCSRRPLSHPEPLRCVVFGLAESPAHLREDISSRSDLFDIEVRIQS